MSALRSAESGQVTVLTIGYAVIALMLVTVVVNLSRVFLAQRALDAAADEAAIAAVQSVRTKPYYGKGVREQLPLARADVRTEVQRQLAASDADRTCDRFRLVDVDPAPRSVTVVVSCKVRIPFANVVSGRYAEGVSITGRATARQTTRP